MLVEAKFAAGPDDAVHFGDSPERSFTEQRMAYRCPAHCGGTGRSGNGHERRQSRWAVSLDNRVFSAYFVRQEANLLPKRLRSKLFHRFVEKPYAEIVVWLSARFQEAAVQPPDLDALALILIESMAAYRELDRVFGEIPAHVDDARFIEAWVEAAFAVAHRYGLG